MDVEVESTRRARASRDALWRGRLPLWQPARHQGYRFNLDSVLLAGFVEPGHHHALELGAGCGIIGLSLLAGGKVRRLTAVERQPQLGELLARNIAAYGWEARARPILQDLRTAALPAADLVVFNPPYFAAHASRPSLQPGRDAGRRECFGTLADFVGRAAEVLAPAGEVAAIVPYSRRHEVLTLLQAAALAPRRLRAVQATADAAPRHLLVAASRCGEEVLQEVRRLPPLLVHRPEGGYTPEVQQLIEGPDAWPGPPGGGADLSPSGG